MISFPTRRSGDAQTRLRVLAEELAISASLIIACADRLRELPGPVSVRLGKIIRVPEGEAYLAIEAPLGIAGVFLVSRGEKTPWRLKLRTPSFNNISSLERVLVGVPDPGTGGNSRLDRLCRRRHRQVADAEGQIARAQKAQPTRAGDRPRSLAATMLMILRSTNDCRDSLISSSGDSSCQTNSSWPASTRRGMWCTSASASSQRNVSSSGSRSRTASRRSKITLSRCSTSPRR